MKRLPFAKNRNSYEHINENRTGNKSYRSATHKYSSCFLYWLYHDRNRTNSYRNRLSFQIV